MSARNSNLILIPRALNLSLPQALPVLRVPPPLKFSLKFSQFTQNPVSRFVYYFSRTRTELDTRPLAVGNRGEGGVQAVFPDSKVPIDSKFDWQRYDLTEIDLRILVRILGVLDLRVICRYFTIVF